MSVHVMSWVMKHSDETLGRRLVLLVLADHAKEDGTCAWPAVATIAHETRLSERQVQYALRGLEDAGAIVRTGRHRIEGQRYGTHVYQVVMTKGAKSAPLDGPKGAIYDIQRVQPIAPKPSLEPSYTTEPNGSVAAAQIAGTAQDVITTVCDAFSAKGIPIPSRHRGMLARQARELLDSDFDFETVVLASVIAEKRGEPQNAHFIAGDLVMARAGERITRREYEKALQDEMEVGRGIA